MDTDSPSEPLAQPSPERIKFIELGAVPPPSVPEPKAESPPAEQSPPPITSSARGPLPQPSGLHPLPRGSVLILSLCLLLLFLLLPQALLIIRIVLLEFLLYLRILLFPLAAIGSVVYLLWRFYPRP